MPGRAEAPQIGVKDRGGGQRLDPQIGKGPDALGHAVGLPQRADLIAGQDAVRQLLEVCDVLIVVGSVSSSNSNRLVELGQRAGKPSYLVDDASHMRREWFAACKVAGVTAGASAPELQKNAMPFHVVRTESASAPSGRWKRSSAWQISSSALLGLGRRLHTNRAQIRPEQMPLPV